MRLILKRGVLRLLYLNEILKEYVGRERINQNSRARWRTQTMQQQTCLERGTEHVRHVVEINCWRRLVKGYCNGNFNWVCSLISEDK